MSENVPLIRNRKFGQDEYVPGLECSYGSVIHADILYRLGTPVGEWGCHNPIEKPEDRYHCEVCGQDYCAVHAARTAHHCQEISPALDLSVPHEDL